MFSFFLEVEETGESSRPTVGVRVSIPVPSFWPLRPGTCRADFVHSLSRSGLNGWTSRWAISPQNSTARSVPADRRTRRANRLSMRGMGPEIDGYGRLRPDVTDERKGGRFEAAEE